MARWICLVIVAALVSCGAQAAPKYKKPPRLWHGYGFLPGYHQPPSNSVPVFEPKQRRGLPRVAQGKRHWYIDPTPQYLGYDYNWHYFGRPGFYGGRYNGGSFGPCYTRTPIGPIWNCG